MSYFLNEPWAADGACVATKDPEVFFPVGEDTQTPEAKRLCNSCPVIVECGLWAVDNWQEGIWGGMTERERAQLRNRKVAR